MDPVDPLDLLEDLVRRPSVTPEDAGCQERIAGELERFGFQSRSMDFGAVKNLWAWHGQGEPTLVLLGHTDVVPPGPEEFWDSPPFAIRREGEYLYGRGVADMKGSVAAMVNALQRFVAEQPDHAGRVALLITSDEEGEAEDGIRKVIPALTEEGIRIDFCLVGEPSSQEVLGDQIRIGRRGSLNAELTVNGVQGHAAYPDLADNPIHGLAPALAEAVAHTWDSGTDGFPPTSFQLTNLEAGTGAVNVIPGQLKALLNFRYNPASTADSLKDQWAEMLGRHGIEFELHWQHSGDPFLTNEGPLVDAVHRAIRQHCGLAADANTGGGTSDGRFVAPTGAQVVELGPVNATIHKVNERVRRDDIPRLADIYRMILGELLG